MTDDHVYGSISHVSIAMLESSVTVPPSADLEGMAAPELMIGIFVAAEAPTSILARERMSFLSEMISTRSLMRLTPPVFDRVIALLFFMHSATSLYTAFFSCSLLGSLPRAICCSRATVLCSSCLICSLSLVPTSLIFSSILFLISSNCFSSSSIFFSL